MLGTMQSVKEYSNEDLNKFCIEVHLSWGYSASDLTDERVMEEPFTSEEIFDYLTKKGTEDNRDL